ncbi:MAG TPA: SDR family oxidoreductase [Solirubrobacteraceae bacterium]|jgi:hypothetical protein|nr:SDR family oxidoreductase [Solirubrobacteraceae bacterium]
MSLPPPSADATVLVTGASSGIGEEMARDLARRGYGSTLVARRRERLDALAAEIEAEHEVKVRVDTCDLGDAEARAALVRRLKGRSRPPVVGVCNNAGYGSLGRFYELALKSEMDEVQLNVAALHHLTGAFLPKMVERGAGAILNTASIAAFQPIPSMATYAATKAFVLSFSESLHEELSGTGVSVSALCPGPTRTEFNAVAGVSDDGGSFSIPGLHSDPGQVARAGIAAMVRGRRVVVPGLSANAMATAGRYSPRKLLLPLTRLVGADRVLR